MSHPRGLGTADKLSVYMAREKAAPGQGKRMRERRKALLLSVPEVAEHVGVSPQSVDDWEAGKSNPYDRNLRKAAEVLRTTPEWIKTGKGKPGQPDVPRSQLDRIEKAISDLVDRLVAADVIRAVEADESGGPPPPDGESRREAS